MYIYISSLLRVNNIWKNIVCVIKLNNFVICYLLQCQDQTCLLDRILVEHSCVRRMMAHRMMSDMFLLVLGIR